MTDCPICQLGCCDCSIERISELEAQCAAMREALLAVPKAWKGVKYTEGDTAAIQRLFEMTSAALASDASKALSEKMADAEEALEQHKQSLKRANERCAEAEEARDRYWERAQFLLSEQARVTAERDEERVKLAWMRSPAESCREERIQGNGGCGACAICCKEATEERDAALSDLKRVTAERDGAIENHLRVRDECLAMYAAHAEVLKERDAAIASRNAWAEKAAHLETLLEAVRSAGPTPELRKLFEHYGYMPALAAPELQAGPELPMQHASSEPGASREPADSDEVKP